jgi:hypothetical protein
VSEFRPRRFARQEESMTRFARVRRLSLADLAMVGQLLAFGGFVAATLRMRGWQRLSQMLVSGSRSRSLRRFPLFHLNYSVESLSAFADMASSVHPRNRCLVRSMILLWLLRSRGEPAEVVLGVRKRAGVFEAHAWTMSDLGPVGDQPEVIAEFETLVTSGRRHL